MRLANRTTAAAAAQRGTVAARSGTASAPSQARQGWLEMIFLGGLASTFLANALIALLQPSDFTSLVENSAIAGWLGVQVGRWLSVVIFLNDFILAVALISTIWSRRLRVVVLGWVGVWLFAVAAIRLSSIQAG